MYSTTASWSDKTHLELLALSDVIMIAQAIDSFRIETGRNPDSATMQKFEKMRDPWGGAYHVKIAPLNNANIIILDTKIKTSVAVWSNGKNRKNENGNGDDICSWEKMRGIRLWH